MEFGQLLHQLLAQVPGETYSLMAQQLMLETALQTKGSAPSAALLKKLSGELAANLKNDQDFDKAVESIKSQIATEPKEKTGAAA